MKKTISAIYRICYIFFALWAFGFLFYPFEEALPVKFLNFTSMANLLCLICIIPFLIISIKKQPPKGILHFKYLCTFLSAIVILCNYDIILSLSSSDRIMCILLPLMIIIDWLLFDRKGSINPGDLIIWLAALIFIGLLLFTLLKNILNLPNVLNLWGLFKNKSDFPALLLKVLAAAAVLYALDGLLSGKSGKGFIGKFAFLWRITFLILEGLALFAVSGKNLSSFIKALSDFNILANFLCFLCIIAVLLWNAVKYHSFTKPASPFPQVKGIFTFSLICVFIIFHFINKQNMTNYASRILYFIAPLMMLFDWLLFDRKGEFRFYDPFIWLILPLIFWIVPYIPGLFAGFDLILSVKLFIILLAAGFIIFAIDKIIKNRT